jgi:p-aminobenzoyl-glutamate transporter AbgT
MNNVTVNAAVEAVTETIVVVPAKPLTFTVEVSEPLAHLLAALAGMGGISGPGSVSGPFATGLLELKALGNELDNHIRRRVMFYNGSVLRNIDKLETGPL